MPCIRICCACDLVNITYIVHCNSTLTVILPDKNANIIRLQVPVLALRYVTLRYVTLCYTLSGRPCSVPDYGRPSHQQGQQHRVAREREEGGHGDQVAWLGGATSRNLRPPRVFDSPLPTVIVCFSLHL